ncbi:Chorion peroxidase like protein [Argiope bruennichi]|uniref:Chorion peroxidase like protein n=1 Tax=Argiope bruennichi TaxID=94029 RepID=A0A8T0EGN0_ARGBR|nr:Chorion peroxidase like protein [Argiope bruennichi]
MGFADVKKPSLIVLSQYLSPHFLFADLNKRIHVRTNRYFSLILIIGLTFTEFCLAGKSHSSICKAGTYSKQSGKDLSGDESNSEFDDSKSSESSNEKFCETTDVEAHISEDPNACAKNVNVLCDPTYPYRMFNGSCNNLNHPNWGVSFECYMRFQPAFYNGFGSIRMSTKGGPLPEPRDLTLNIFKNLHRPTRKVSFMFTIFGQTEVHDVTLSFPANAPSPCCAPENKDAPACIPISVPSYDPFYSRFNITCLEMIRTLPCSTCNTGKRQQSNGVTAALDSSLVYGADDERANQVRANDGSGKLKSNNTENGELLPTGIDPLDIFCYKKIQSKCFFAGDFRVNQHATLTGLQTLYMREHNRVAAELKRLNSHWGEESLFQEARRINIAEIQCITFKEYLPYLLGPSLMKKFDLSLKNGTEGSKYNAKVRLGMWNEFPTACFRLHSMVATEVGALNLRFKNLYSNPGLIHQGHMGQLLQGVCKVPSEKYDHWFVNDTTDFLYLPPDVPYGNDISSTDIQRGREHGLAPYVHLVRYCFGNKVNISSFADLAPGLMSCKNANLLQKNYKSVEDVDLWVGIQMEHHLPDQRASLKQCSLSRILCDNTPIKEIQKNTMLLQSKEDSPK